MGKWTADGDLKPAFSNHWRAFNPLLCAEDTNPLFRAFRLRRHYKRPAMRKLTRFRMIPNVVKTENIKESFIILFIAMPFMFLSMGFLAIPMGFALVGTNVRRRWEGTYLPYRAQSLAFEAGYQAEAAVDMWMSGMKGRDLLEAVYLEGIEFRHRSTYYAGAVMAAAYAIWIWKTKQPFMMLHLAVFGAMALSFWRAAYVNQLRQSELFCQRAKMLLTYWANPSLVQAFVICSTRILLWVLHWLLGAVIWVVLILLVAALIFWQRDLLEWTGYIAAFRVHPLETGLLSLFVFSAIYNTFLARYRLNAAISRLKSVFESADEPLDYFMARHVMKDIDAENWAGAAFGWENNPKVMTTQTAS